MKKNRKIARLLFLASLAIAAILTACPSTDKDGEKASGFKFRAVSSNTASRNIHVYFEKDLAAAAAADAKKKKAAHPDPAKIVIKDGSTTLDKADYSLAIGSSKELVITIGSAKFTATKEYTVEIKAGAVKDGAAKSKLTNAAKTIKVTPNHAIPTLKGSDSLILKSGDSNKKTLQLVFQTNSVEIIDAKKIHVELKTTEYGDAEVTAKKLLSSDKKIIEITLKNAYSSGQTYRVTVKPGAVKDASATSKLTNFEDLVSTEIAGA